MAESIDRLSIEIVSDASKAADTVERLTTQLIALKNALKGIDASGLKNLSNAVNKASASNKQATASTKQLNSAYKTLVSTTKQIASQQVSLRSTLLRVAGVFGTIYAACFMLVRAFGALKKAINYAADLTEIQNVVDVTFGNAASKIDEFTKTSIKDFGINELSVKTFAARYQSMGVAMGITNEQVKNAHEYLSQFRTPTGAINGYNEMSNSMADMSINLTKLTGDLASFYDQNQEDVAQALQSGIFAGQTRPLRQYGVDLTQATLQEWALSQGINANIASMTQAEKTMLRYEYTMQRLGMAQGDFVRTQHTWANQVRVLRQQFQALGAVIGQGLIQALKPALIAFNQFLSRVIEFAKKVLNALGKIFGWKVDISGGGLDTDLSEAEEAATGLGDALGGAGDNAGDAADKVKELKKQLQGFDKLNVLTTTETGGGSGGSGGGGGGSGSGGGGGGAGSANDIAVNLQKTEGLFESDINNLRELGVYIRNALMDAMDNIPWDSIYEKARGFGSGLASFLNGLFSGSGKSNVFASLGRTVAGAINTALNFFDSFADVFDFSTFGRNLASFFVEAVANIDWSLAGEAFHEWMQGIKDAFVAFVKYLSENKEEVFQAIKDFLSEITIEDIGIFIAMITITKIGKWVLAGGVYELAKKAIGALFKDIGIAITAKITGLSFAEASALGAKGLILQLIGSNGLITNALGLALLEGTGAATVGGALATFALPIAFAITPLIFHKILRNMYSDAKEEGDKVKQNIIENAFGKKASVSRRRTADGDVYDVELGAVINWKVLFGKLTDKLPWKGKGFFKWLAELLFPKTVKTTDGKDLEIDYSINLGFKLDTKFGKGKFSKWLEKNLGIKNNEDTVTATTGIAKGRTWDSGKKEYNSVHDETATKSIAGRTNTSYSQRKTDFNNFKSNTATKTIAGATASTFTTAKNNYNGLTSNTAIKTLGGSVQKSFWDARSYYNGMPYESIAWKSLKGYQYQSFKDARSAFNAIYNKTVEVGIKAAVSNVSSTAKNLIKTLFNALFAEGGIKMASGWQPITAYASGGMPSSAEVFMARENGLPEMVGRIGNHTAVMNNDQIVASVASGVAMAVSGQNELLIQQNSLLRQILAKETGISSRDIFNAVRSENNNYINRTGSSAFA